MKLQDKILQLCDTFGEPRLKALLQSATFFTDPGSIKRHHAFAGGLALHSFGVFYQLLRIDPEGMNPASLFRVAMIHDLSKVGTYVAARKSQKKTDVNGDPVTYTDGRGVQKFEWIDVDCFEHKSHTAPVMGHADTSIFMAVKAGILLSDAEIMAIRWHMGRADTIGEDSLRANRAAELSSLVLLTQTADAMDALQPVDPADLPEIMNRVDSLVRQRREIAEHVTACEKKVVITNAAVVAQFGDLVPVPVADKGESLTLDELEAQADAIDSGKSVRAGEGFVPNTVAEVEAQVNALDAKPQPGFAADSVAGFVDKFAATGLTFASDDFTAVAAHAMGTPGGSNADRIRALVNAAKQVETGKPAPTCESVKPQVKHTAPEPDAVKQAIASQDEFTF